MPTHRHTVAIDETASEQQIAVAAELLQRGEAVVLWAGQVALRATLHELVCEVIDPTPSAHRCSNEYQVLVENAARAMEKSKLWAVLPKRPLRWVVVEHRGSDRLELCVRSDNSLE